MNVFFVDRCPYKAAQSLVDSHVVKMVVESAQLLSTAHRVLDGTPISVLNENGRRVKRWVLPDDRETVLYLATHQNHPSAVWSRANKYNYKWLYCHWLGLMQEYKHRYGKQHSCERMIFTLCKVPNNIADNPFTDPPPAMDKQYIISDNSIDNYRNYYNTGKRHLHKYTNRTVPPWITQC